VPVALVTGASGFVGSHIVDGLVERGWSVRALVRATSSPRWVHPQAIRVEGDVRDPAGLPAAVEGVDAVFHAAGITRAVREVDYRRVNLNGTEHLIRAATASARPPARFVLVSSVAAGGPSPADRPRCERDPDLPQGPYGRSKLAAERALREGAGPMAWSIVRPVAVYGPRDVSFLILARLARRGWVPRINGDRQVLQVIHVRDLALATIAAGTVPAAAGRTYYLSHPELTSWEALARLMAKARRKRAVRLPVPGKAVSGIGLVVRAAGAPWGKNPLPRDRIRDLLAAAWTCDGTRAREELGVTPRIGLAEGIPDLMTWYAREGFL
jgi:nucleoside-diphosphate-sugar epimerase